MSCFCFNMSDYTNDMVCAWHLMLTLRRWCWISEVISVQSNENLVKTSFTSDSTTLRPLWTISAKCQLFSNNLGSYTCWIKCALCSLYLDKNGWESFRNILPALLCHFSHWFYSTKHNLKCMSAPKTDILLSIKLNCTRRLQVHIP